MTSPAGSRPTLATVTDVPDDSDEAQIGYQPFPAFAEWASLPVESAVYDGYAAMLDRLRAETEPERLARAVRTATRLAAIDTGAIEGLYEVDRGFTMTVAVQSATWEAAIDAREPVVRRSFEDALRAYDFVLDIATGRTEISEKAIKEIHALICASQDTYRVFTSLGWQERPLPRAEYKTLPNNPIRTATGRTHAYARPSDTPAEMARLVTELRSAGFQDAHPVLQAAYAHYAFVAIHPFADGNGRVARALASAYLYRRPGVPLVIFADQKDEYLDALEAADSGHAGRLVQFVTDRVADVIGIIQAGTPPAESPSVAVSLAALSELRVGGSGLPVDEMEAVALRIHDAATSEVLKQIADLPLPDGITARLQSSASAMRWGPDKPYQLARSGWQEVVLSARGVATDVAVGVAVRWSGDPAFLLVASRVPELPIELRDVYPVLRTVFSIKLAAWSEAVIAALLADLEARAREAYRADD